MTRMNLTCAALAIAVTGVVVPSTVFAQGRPVVVTGEIRPTAVVSYADLNLNHEDGVQHLFRRVRQAATGLCMDPGRIAIKETLEGWACRDDAIAGAQDQVDSAINSSSRQSFAAAQTITVALK